MDPGRQGLVMIFQVSPAGVHVGSLSPLGSLRFSVYLKKNLIALVLV